ncbi:SurA N-terminal domain-containing protein [Candidatus Nitronereus thalassa]|uniref:SurA N-terminal domain-containing protein n=1 Tax=Candidatus Nitronereus thalassa TaxID=3020898 RepID=A0ABU3K7K8_9BACT|nr:SurA N-terminal domain-containing protein [Candidatus Nitronereus thalassa]MDT7042402.1 SurA N-terminal domain-containing protein [Candidatus Nitronereus thalassa]
MIKLIREGSKNHPWLLKLIIILIAVTFVIGMGWFGYESSQQPNAVAMVGPYNISLEEFRRSYNRMYRFYKDELKQEIVDEADLKQQVIQSMVDQKVWLLTADEWDLDVSPELLRDEIMKKKEFQKDGKFDADLYHRLLAANRYTPKQFEAQLIKDLRTQQAQVIVQDVATLNPSEIQEAEELAARQTAGMEDEAEKERVRQRIRLQILFQKKQRALQAFQNAKRLRADVEIREEFL